MTCRRLAFTLVATTLGLASGSARAQSKDDVAFADALFRQGVTLLKEGDDAGACARFAQSKELAPAVGVSLYLADCLQRVGKPASAWREFRSAEALATERKDKRAALARRRADALAPGLDRLTIQVAPSLEDSLRVSLDGKAVERDDWGTAIPVDPGNHVVVARSGQAERVFEAFVDANRTTASVQIDQLVEDRSDEKSAPTTRAGGAGLPPVVDSEAERSASEKPSGLAAEPARLWLSIGLAGLGAAGIGVGTGFGIAAKNARDESNAGPCNASDHCTPNGLSLRHEAINDALVSTVAFVVGASALGACAVVTLVIPRGANGDPVTVAPTPLAGGAGAILRTTF
jgi:hypothetical protein